MPVPAHVCSFVAIDAMSHPFVIEILRLPVFGLTQTSTTPSRLFNPLMNHDLDPTVKALELPFLVLVA
jgi:hypothetical protein